jgi:cytochrome bd-type quinol oxidase subunit 2
LNVVATVIVSVLVGLSLILMVTTVFPHVNVVSLASWLGVILAVLLVTGGVVWLLRRGEIAPKADFEVRAGWRMPQSVLLDRPALVGWRKLVLTGLFAYLILSVALLVVKAIQIG